MQTCKTLGDFFCPYLCAKNYIPAHRKLHTYAQKAAYLCSFRYVSTYPPLHKYSATTAHLHSGDSIPVQRSQHKYAAADTQLRSGSCISIKTQHEASCSFPIYFINQLHIYNQCATQTLFTMRYKLILRRNPADPSAPKKYYAAPIHNGMITKKEMADDLILISSISRGDISSVIENFLDAIPKFLLRGFSVQLGELGTLRISFSSEGVDNPKDFVVTMVRGKKIIFRPGPAFKKILRDLILEKEK